MTHHTTQQTPSDWNSYVSSILAKLRRAALERHLRPLPAQPPGFITHDSTRLVNFTSNDYLSLSTHPTILRAAHDAIDQWGLGATASRLISGTKTIHQDAERALAVFKHTDAALIFPSGYQANLGTITALADQNAIIYSDERNHASIVDAVRLSSSSRRIYRHRDPNHLDHLLSQDNAVGLRKLVVTDTLFSTTGTRAPLKDLESVCSRHGALLVVDEAHATGVLGPAGAGLCAQLGIAAPVQVATLSKAFGLAGGFVASSEPIRNLLINRARSFIYTTAPPPLLSAAAIAAAAILSSDQGDRLRARVLQNAQTLRAALRSQGWTVQGSDHILSVILADPQTALRAATLLEDRGIYALPFRPPTVPPGSCLLRLATNAAHGPQDLEIAAAAFASLRKTLPLPNIDTTPTTRSPQ